MKKQLMTLLGVSLLSVFTTAQAKPLVIYFSQPESVEKTAVDGYTGASILIKNQAVKGHNQFAAEAIARATQGDLFRLETAKPYPDVHQPLLDYAQEEQRRNEHPALKAVPNVADYDEVILVYPIWWYKMPMILHSLFDSQDFKGKTLRLYTVHGGSRFSGSDREIKARVPNAKVLNGLAIYRNHLMAKPEQVEQELIDHLKLQGLAK